MSAGGNSSRWLHWGPGGVALGFFGCVRGACAGHWAGWVCRWAWGSLRWVCAGCRVWGVVRGVRRVGPWTACAVVWAGGGGPCRGAVGDPTCPHKVLRGEPPARALAQITSGRAGYHLGLAMLCLAQWILHRWQSTGTVPWIWAR